MSKVSLEQQNKTMKTVLLRNAFIENFSHDRYGITCVVYPDINGRFPMASIIFNKKTKKKVAHVFWKINLLEGLLYQ